MMMSDMKIGCRVHNGEFVVECTGCAEWLIGREIEHIATYTADKAERVRFFEACGAPAANHLKKKMAYDDMKLTIMRAALSQHLTSMYVPIAKAILGFERLSDDDESV